MSTEVATTEDQFVPVLGSGFGDPLGAVTMYADVIDTAYNLAEKLCRTPLVGTVYRGKPADAAVAILYGAEIGLNPIQSLQQIFTVHGTPAIYARTMVALLKRRGYRFQTVESTDEQVTVTGTSPTGDTETSTWTIERADRAGYIPKIDERTGKYAVNGNGKLIGNEKYITDPQAMLYAKAAAEVCRRLAPDVLLGISRTSEDLESEPAPAPVRVVSERVTAADLLGDVVDGNAAPTIAEWVDDRPPAEPSESGEKQDTAQVSEPPAESTPAKPRTSRARRAAATEAPPASTPEQQAEVSRLLGEQGVTEPEDKLAAVAKYVGRELASAAEMTAAEADSLTAYLRGDETAGGAQ